MQSFHPASDLSGRLLIVFAAIVVGSIFLQQVKLEQQHDAINGTKKTTTTTAPSPLPAAGAAPELEDNTTGTILNEPVKLRRILDQLFQDVAGREDDYIERSIPGLFIGYFNRVPVDRRFHSRSRRILESSGRAIAQFRGNGTRLLVPLIELTLDKSRSGQELLEVAGGDQCSDQCPASRQLAINSTLQSCCRCLVPVHCEPPRAGQCPPKAPTTFILEAGDKTTAPTTTALPDTTDSKLRILRRRDVYESATSEVNENQIEHTDGLRLFKTNLRLLVKDPTLRQELVGAFDSLPSRVDGHHWPRAIELLAYLGDQVDEPEWNGGSIPKTSSNNGSDKPGVRFTRLCSRRNTKALLGHLLERFRRSLLGPSRCKQCQLIKPGGLSNGRIMMLRPSGGGFGCPSVPCPACPVDGCPVNPGCLAVDNKQQQQQLLDDHYTTNDTATTEESIANGSRFGSFAAKKPGLANKGRPQPGTKVIAKGPARAASGKAARKIGAGSGKLAARSPSRAKSAMNGGPSASVRPRASTKPPPSSSSPAGGGGILNPRLKGKLPKSRSPSGGAKPAPAASTGSVSAGPKGLGSTCGAAPLNRPSFTWASRSSEPFTSTPTRTPPNNSTGYIVNGRRQKYGRWPSFVRLNIVDQDDPDYWDLCGGALIDASHVLTAAHCVVDGETQQVREAAEVSVLAGDHSVSEHDRHERELQVSKICLSSRYDDSKPSGPEFDYAVLTLAAAPIDRLYSDHIQPACLPAAPPTYANCWVVGAGATGWRHKDPVDPEPIRAEFVQELQASKSDCSRQKLQADDPSRMCFTRKGGPGDSCAGDSGGPVLCLENDRWTVVALVSYGTPWCDGDNRNNWQGVYANVHALLADIKRDCGI